ncbi:MAG: 1-deoxy-D-xylulose-5-phosphate reductoisomerase, partial [Vicinamibacteria bacterium]
MKRIAILGTTGSIGTSALAVADAHPDRVRLVAMAAGNNVDVMAAAVTRHRPSAVAMGTGEGLDRLRAALGGTLPPVHGAGAEGLVAVAT